MSKFDKQKERWNRIKSREKKRYLLKVLFIYIVFSILFTTINVFVLNRIILTYIPYVITAYLISLIGFSLLGILFGNKSWNVNTNKFDLEYRIGDKYIDSVFPNCIFTIVAISPKVDYNGGLSYFVEVEEIGQIHYIVVYEDQLKERVEKVN